MRCKSCLLALCAIACGPTPRDLEGAVCIPGEIRDCYTGKFGTAGIGPCRAGTERCRDDGQWSACDDIAPQPEICTDGIDNNCNGRSDENVDEDGDGYTTCGGDCCDSTECGDPPLVNTGAFDAPANEIDDDCNGAVDDTPDACDHDLASDSMDGFEFAHALDLCRTATLDDQKWGVISAKLTLADGLGVPAWNSHAIRGKFGSNLLPRHGSSLVLISTGSAAGVDDQAPPWHDFQHPPNTGNATQSPFPADFLAANQGTLPNAPGCPQPRGDHTFDPMMLTFEIRVPSNAKSFTLDTNFFSSEFPEWTCSPFNDFFVVLLDSAWDGEPANPADKNLAFYTQPETLLRFPVGVNLATGSTGLFTQCLNGTTGCGRYAVLGTIASCLGTEQLAGTGLEAPYTNWCNGNSVKGGGTGWLKTSGNVKGGEIIKLRIAIWDTSDHILDSIAVIDAFTWSVDAASPGTVIY